MAFPKIFKYTEENKRLLEGYSHLMWRLSHNSEIFGSYKNFSFKSRCKYVFKHPMQFVKYLYLNRDMVLELIKAWYIWRQTPMRKAKISKYMFPEWYS